MPCIFSIIRKNKTALQLSLVPKRTLSSILTVIIAKDMPVHQFEATKDLLKKAKIHNIETQQRTLILNAIRKSGISSCFIVSSGHWAIFKNLCKQVYQYIMIVLNIPVFICTLFVQVTTKNFPEGTLLAHFLGRRPFGRRRLTHNDYQTLAAMTS